MFVLKNFIQLYIVDKFISLLQYVPIHKKYIHIFLFFCKTDVVVN